MTAFLERRNSAWPYQYWNQFPPEAIVQVKNVHGDSAIGLAKDFWWGFDSDSEATIVKARRLDRLKRKRLYDF
jgi:hypothetical protein